ncbi:4a-hydroxytetrahydrobiopterin dehydratase [Psychromonas sp. SP041]|uniref:4a-hydroxytetrahydrobiopterin dehydratase n=1 Tax=Psychromonas sp. SP041 TaxID=1365007 RepID=UPI0004278B7A|nr:4a-hydroxytetrahydrobiopterin dehydratase [Psychromonas sp. SP041]
MTLLTEQTCSACNANSTEQPLAVSDMSELLVQLKTQFNDWSLIEDKGVGKLSCEFVTKRYSNSIRFTNQVAALAESVNHHPLIIVEYGMVTVQWWSHNIKGLHQNDFIMAAKTSALFLDC